MKMRMCFSPILALSVLLFFTSTLDAAGRGKLLARGMIKRSAVVVFIAYKKVKENKNYTGDLARAIAHQKLAKKFYRRGEYFRAMHQTKRARWLAVQAIKANKGQEPKEGEMTRAEKTGTGKGPSDEKLDAELRQELPDEPARDQDILSSTPDMDIK